VTWNHLSPEWTEDPYTIWDNLRQQCPIAHTREFGGAWLPVTYDAIVQTAKNTDDFSSVTGIIGQEAFEPAPIGVTPPISSDPPYHKAARDLMMPVFSPPKVRELEEFLTEKCNQWLDELQGVETFDASEQYASKIPPAIISKILGLPEEDRDQFLEIIHICFESLALSMEDRNEKLKPVLKYLVKEMGKRKREPRDDFITQIINAEIDGQPISSSHKFGSILLMIIAGIDTAWSSISAAIWHLGQNPDDFYRLKNEPELMDIAIEEFLRFYAPVSMARVVKHDTEFMGCPMKKDEWVLIPYAAGNRDPEVFENADKFIIDRKNNRHIAFGSGIHRCAGAGLARMEIKVALTAFINRYPFGFELSNPESVKWSPGQVRGPRTVPIVIL